MALLLVGSIGSEVVVNSMTAEINFAKSSRIKQCSRNETPRRAFPPVGDVTEQEYAVGMVGERFVGRNHCIEMQQCRRSISRQGVSKISLAHSFIDLKMFRHHFSLCDAPCHAHLIASSVVILHPPTITHQRMNAVSTFLADADAGPPHEAWPQTPQICSGITWSVCCVVYYHKNPPQR